MTTVKDSIFDLGQFQIPRPKCIGMEFVTIRGTHSGFYRSINKNIAQKYGLQQRNFEVPSTKRPSIPEEWTKNNEESVNKIKNKKENNNGSIPEEPENVLEPLPDYEVEGNEGKKEGMVTVEIEMRKDAIAVNKSELSPPLKEEMNRMALSSTHNNENKTNINKEKIN
ncbi:unnamed protein product [Meloidogyne enterolobii]|uniref:Uncharacterized protein n=1 Tax=Meloidogyne enterolobii TaxID=390850 RepID=A0ACB0Y632_MELEN